MTNSILAVSVAAAAIVGAFTLPTIEPNYGPTETTETTELANEPTNEPTTALFYGQEWQPCEHEDSLGCYWDSSTRGNGLGNSFIALDSGERIYELELPPCEHEDSLGCYWDASTRGNGQGTSFVALESGELIYLP